MIDISDGKIGNWELFAIVMILIGLKAGDMTPDILIESGLNAAWIVALFSAIVTLIPLLVLLPLVIKHHGLIELIYDVAGKWAGTVFCVVLFIVCMNAATINSRSYIEIVNDFFYPTTAPAILFILFMVTCYFITKLGIVAMGSSSLIILVPSMILNVLLLIMVWQKANWTFLFPIAGSGLKTIMMDGLKYSSIYGDVLFVMLFLPSVRPSANIRYASLLGLGSACLLIVGLSVLYTAVFDYPSLEFLSYPYQNLTREASFIYSNAHFESFFLGFWLIASIIHFGIYLYAGNVLFTKIFRLKHFQAWLLPIAATIFVIGSHIENIMLIFNYRKMTLTLSSVFLIILPFILWSLERLKGREHS